MFGAVPADDGLVRHHLVRRRPPDAARRPRRLGAAAASRRRRPRRLPGVRRRPAADAPRPGRSPVTSPPADARRRTAQQAAIDRLRAAVDDRHRRPRRRPPVRPRAAGLRRDRLPDARRARPDRCRTGRRASVPARWCNASARPRRRGRADAASMPTANQVARRRRRSTARSGSSRGRRRRRRPTGSNRCSPADLADVTQRIFTLIVEPVDDDKALAEIRAAAARHGGEQTPPPRAAPAGTPSKPRKATAVDEREQELAAGHTAVGYAGLRHGHRRRRRPACNGPHGRCSAASTPPGAPAPAVGTDGARLRRRLAARARPVPGAVLMARPATRRRGRSPRSPRPVPDGAAGCACPGTGRRPPTCARSTRPSSRPRCRRSARCSATTCPPATARCAGTRSRPTSRGWSTNPNVFVMGEPGFSKSSLIKCWAVWQHCLYGPSRWLTITDPKGEYRPLAERLGMSVMRLAPGGDGADQPARSPSRASTGESARRRNGRAGARCSTRWPPPSSPARCTRSNARCCAPSSHVTDRHRGTAPPTLLDVVALLETPTDEMCDRRHARRDELRPRRRGRPLRPRRAVHRAARAACSTGPPTSTVDWTGAGLVMDLSGVVDDERAMALVMVAAIGWSRQQRHRLAGRQRINVNDESYYMYRQAETVEFAQERRKLGRQLRRSEHRHLPPPVRPRRPGRRRHQDRQDGRRAAVGHLDEDRVPPSRRRARRARPRCSACRHRAGAASAGSPAAGRCGRSATAPCSPNTTARRAARRHRHRHDDAPRQRPDRRRPPCQAMTDSTRISRCARRPRLARSWRCIGRCLRR